MVCHIYQLGGNGRITGGRGVVTHACMVAGVGLT